MESEKRSDKRQVLDVDVKVNGISGKSRNLSMGGMCAILSESVPVLQDIMVIIYLPDHKINILSKALRCTPITKDYYEVGIYFQTANMSQENREKLADYLGIILPD